MDVNSKNTQTNLTLFLHRPSMKTCSGRIYANLSMAVSSGERREGNGTGQGNTQDHNFLSDVLCLEKDKGSEETL